MTYFYVGAAEVDITPPTGLTMDGYVARSGVSVGVHDPLMAQVLIIERGDMCAVIVTLDVLAVSGKFALDLRQSIAQLVGTDTVWLCPSHTHCGPRGLQNWFPVGQKPQLDHELTQLISRRVNRMVDNVYKSLVPARMFSASGDLHGVGGDRNQQGAIVDNRLTTFRFESLSGDTIAVLFHYACHPTVLGPDTREYSADWPGAARKRIQAHYPEATVAFMNGATGNVSTRYFRRESTFAEVERLGGIVADRALELLSNADEEPQVVMDYGYKRVSLPVREFPLGRELETTGDARRDTTRSEGTALESELAEAFNGRESVSAYVNKIKLGDWTLFGISGEAFSDLALAVREHDPKALVVGLVNDYAGYFPTQAAINAATYEALSSPYDAHAHQALVHLLTNHDWL